MQKGLYYNLLHPIEAPGETPYLEDSAEFDRQSVWSQPSNRCEDVGMVERLRASV